jgi:hypothetical protein
MAVSVAFTLAEACEILDPPMTEQQLRLIITALALTPAGNRYTGKAGRPHPTYDAATILRIHAALLPWLEHGSVTADDSAG